MVCGYRYPREEGGVCPRRRPIMGVSLVVAGKEKEISYYRPRVDLQVFRFSWLYTVFQQP